MTRCVAFNMCNTHLTRVLQQVLPFSVTDTRLLLQDLKVRKLSIVAESQDQKIVELLRLRRPLSLYDTCTGPGGLTNEVSIFLLL